MHINAVGEYRCPATGSTLTLEVARKEGDLIQEGTFTSAEGARYRIENGVPNFNYPPVLKGSDEESYRYYMEKADEYDAYLPLTFATFGVDEAGVRNRMIDDLCLTPNSRVLETGAGTGRDSELILKRLGNEGKLFVQDICPGILAHAVGRLTGATPAPEFLLSNGSYLPFPDKTFDAYYHFGGLNTFDDIARALREAVRVTKIGGKVVVGDESMPLWLRDTEFGKVLMNSNPHYRFPLPLEHMPVEARNTRLRWILGEVFYVIDFEVGEGTPYADLDFPIPGPRGGTHRTRYYGHLEGVTPEAKKQAIEAAAKAGKSLHEWLTEVIKRSV